VGDEALTLRVLETLGGIAPDEWNALAQNHPFLRY